MSSQCRKMTYLKSQHNRVFVRVTSLMFCSIVSPRYLGFFVGEGGTPGLKLPYNSAHYREEIMINLNFKFSSRIFYRKFKKLLNVMLTLFRKRLGFYFTMLA